MEKPRKLDLEQLDGEAVTEDLAHALETSDSVNEARWTDEFAASGKPGKQVP